MKHAKEKLELVEEMNQMREEFYKEQEIMTHKLEHELLEKQSQMEELVELIQMKE